MFLFCSHRGEMLTVQSGEISAAAWMDNKVVTAMFTGFAPGSISTVSRMEKTRESITVQCPEAIAVYNQQMGGVDKGDQLRGYYHRHTKGRKYYR